MKKVFFLVIVMCFMAISLIAQTTSVYIGNANSSTYGSYAPFNFFFRQSLAQTLYTAQQIQNEGTITEIVYRFNNDIHSITQRPINVYMANVSTQITSLTNWYPFSNFTLVYSGMLTDTQPPPGNVPITITLDTPFYYSGDNLIIYTYNNYTGDIPIPTFGFQQTPQNVSITVAAYSDIVTFDPANPPNGYLFPNMPNIELIFENIALGAVEGTVSDEDGPLEGVQISVVGSGIYTLTAADGTYFIDNLVPGEISLRATKWGYNDEIASVTIIADEIVTQDFFMTERGTITISGTVIASDTEEGLEGASVSLSVSGYEAITDEDGFYLIPDVFVNLTYTISAFKEGYEPFTGHIIVGNADIVYDIMLIENCYPPRNVYAYIDTESNAVITWSSAGIPEEVWFSHSSNDINFTDEIPSPDVSSWEIAHRYTIEHLADFGINGSILTKIAFFPRILTNQMRLKIYIDGVDGNPGALVLNQVIPFYLINEWNTIELDYPIQIYGNGELWIALYMEYNSYLADAIRFDNGPLLPGYGNLINLDGLGWDTGEITGNWAIKGLAEVTTMSDDLSSRGLESYQILRTNNDNIYNQNLWDLIATNVPGLTYIDTTWSVIQNDIYIYAVQAIYTGGYLSPPVFSNIVTSPPQGCVVYVTISPLDGGSANEAIVHFEHNYFPNVSYTELTDHTNTAFFINLIHGPYTLTIDATGYEIYIDSEMGIIGESIWLNIPLNPITSDEDNYILPIRTELKGNYPNPFNPSTTIIFDKSIDGNVIIDIFNIKGQKIKTLTNKYYTAGQHSVIWDGLDNNINQVSSGIYFYKMETAEYTSIKKMILLK